MKGFIRRPKVSNQNILVTSGASYVGNAIVARLVKDDYPVTVLDNLKHGHSGAIHPKARFINSNICDKNAVENVYKHMHFDAVMHMAAETIVSFHTTDPQKYIATNVSGNIHILDAMLKHDIRKFIFSSSAAVYGEPTNTPIDEIHPTPCQ